MSAKKSTFTTQQITNFLQSLHIYDNKGEAFFKTFVVTISWVGGVRLSKNPDEITRTIAATFFIFALSLIMEYVIKLITSKNFVPKIFPFCLCGMNGFVVIVTAATLLDRSFEHIEYKHLYWAAFLSLIILWFDTATMILIEPSQEPCTEHKLKRER